MLKTQPLHGLLTIKLAPDLALPAALQASVDRVWEAAIVQNSQLFDGSIFTVVDYAGDRMLLARGSYRHIVAARHDNAIKQALGLKPLAVSGILAGPGGFLFGRRARTVAQGAGLWELAPSGAVDAGNGGATPDLGDEILRELREEIGLTQDQVIVQPPVGIVEDSESGVVDIVLPLATGLSAAEIAAAHETRGSDEYDAVHIAASPHDFVQARDDILPETRVIVDLFAQRWID